MDRVRFGRALGFGARMAAKTLVSAVDAATAENPAGKSVSANNGQVADTQTRPTVSSAPSGAAQRVVETAGRTAAQTREAKQGLRRGSKRLGESVWGPFVRLSGVLWLEVTGVFFGLFAVIAMGGVWRLRGEWHRTATNVAAHRNLLGAIAMLALFGYFCVSSFVRARQRERRR